MIFCITWWIKSKTKADLLARYREHHTEDAEILLISFGSAARTALHMVEQRRQRGLKVGLLELQTLWPFPRQLVRRMCKEGVMCWWWK